MDPKEQLRLLSRIWGHNFDGFIFLPYIPGEWANKPQRKSKWKEGRAYLWPDDKQLILGHLIDHQNDELYFTPLLFNARERKEDYADSERVLYADLDRVTPEQCQDKGFYPTVSWETSEGHYQAIWIMRGRAFKNGASWPGMENQRLTYYLGADKSGWHSTKLLRVPGSRHHKANVYQGKVTETEGPTYRWEDFTTLPEVKYQEQEKDVIADDLLEEIVSGINRKDVWDKYRSKVSTQVKEYIRTRSIDPDTVDRSEIAWQIERDLAKAGATLSEIIALIRPTPWNKYSDSPQELKRLKREVNKAIFFKEDKSDDLGEELVQITLDEKELTDFSQSQNFLNQKRPKWLVKNFMVQGACGFIAAPPKSMKSWLGLDLAFSLSRGLPFLEQDVKPVNVLYIQQEDPGNLILQRLSSIAYGKDHHWRGKLVAASRGDKMPWWLPPKPHPKNLIPLVMKGFNAGDISWQDKLDELIEDYEIGFCLMDTLHTVAPGVDVDKAKEIKSEVLDPIRNIGRKHNCAMFFVHHNKKSADHERTGQNMSGSGQIHAWADTTISIYKKETSSELTLTVETKVTSTTRLKYKANWAEDGSWFITPLISTVAEFVDNPKPRKSNGRGRKTPLANLQKTQDYMEKNPKATLRQIADFVGVSPATAMRYRDKIFGVDK